VRLPPGGCFTRNAAYFLHVAASLARKRPVPIVGGISVTDICNLDCAHCWRKNQGCCHGQEAGMEYGVRSKEYGVRGRLGSWVLGLREFGFGG
jgi:hypothetical protein